LKNKFIAVVSENIRNSRSNAPRLKSRGFKHKVLGHSSPSLKATGYSGQFNKQMKRKHPLHRWIAERAHAWLNHYRSIFTRWTRRYDTFEAMFAFACSCRIFQMMGVFG